MYWKNEEENFHLLHFHFPYNKIYISVFLELSSSQIYNLIDIGHQQLEIWMVSWVWIHQNLLKIGQKTANFDEFRLTKPFISPTVGDLCRWNCIFEKKKVQWTHWCKFSHKKNENEEDENFLLQFFNTILHFFKRYHVDSGSTLDYLSISEEITKIG